MWVVTKEEEAFFGKEEVSFRPAGFSPAGFLF
jgi:hypothetical protein